MAGHDPRRVPPFGHLGIEGRVRLPPDYRGLPRPSSASCAKASAARPYYLRFPLVSVSQKMISDGYAHRSIALRSQMRLSWLLQSPPRGGPQENRIVYVREPCDFITRVVSISMKTLCSCQGARGRAPGAGCWERRRPVGPLLPEPDFDLVYSLPRKEVIQPHVPVRLPCYDFTPLTLHTFDASAP